MQTLHRTASHAHLQAIRRVLALPLDPSAVEDMLFWEAWERDPDPDPGAVLRVTQLRRAHPTLAAAIRKEVSSAIRTIPQHLS